MGTTSTLLKPWHVHQTLLCVAIQGIEGKDNRTQSAKAWVAHGDAHLESMKLKSVTRVTGKCHPGDLRMRLLAQAPYKACKPTRTGRGQSNMFINL